MRCAEISDVHAGQDDFLRPGFDGLRAWATVSATLALLERPRANGMVQNAQK